MFGLLRISLQSMKLCELRLGSTRVRNTNTIDAIITNTSIAGSQGSAVAGGIPQSGTPGIGGGLRSSRIFDNSDRSPELSSEGVEEVDASAGVAADDVGSASSSDLERG